MNDQPETQNSVPAEPMVGLKKVRKRSGILWTLCLLLVVVLVTALVTFAVTVRTFFHKADDRAMQLQILDKLLNEEAYYEPQHEQMLAAALKAYVGASGDKYTRYYTQEEYNALTEENEGYYVGIGVTTRNAVIRYLDEEITALEVIRFSPQSSAPESGLLVGDYIYAVKTEDSIQYVNDIGSDIAINLVKGEEGTTVDLLWLSKENEELVLKEGTLLRKEVTRVAVDCFQSKINPEIGVVKLYQFDLNTPVQLCQSIDALLGQGVTGLVLDLRDNGGGDLLSVVACASYFLEPGDPIITAENKDGEKDTQYAIVRNYSSRYAPCSVEKNDIGKYRDLEIAVLVNEDTASAAELLAAVFRDYELAPIVGTKTYGKGSMQTLISLAPYGMEGGIKITTDLYYPPSGEGYNGIGIVPDFVVEADGDFVASDFHEAQDDQLVFAMDVLLK